MNTRQIKQSCAVGIEKNPSHVAIVVTCLRWCLTQSQGFSSAQRWFTLQERQTQRGCITSLWVDAEDVAILLPSLWQTKDSLASIGREWNPSQTLLSGCGAGSEPCCRAAPLCSVPWRQTGCLCPGGSAHSSLVNLQPLPGPTKCQG